jgi:hypothetical protein
LGAADYPPFNAVGGRIGIQSAAPFTGLNGSYYICSANILGRHAKQLDIQLDDGNTATGSLVVGTPASPAVAPLATASVTDAGTFTVCMGI